MDTRRQISHLGTGRFLLIAIALLLGLQLQAQSDPLLESFSISKNDGQVLLNWVTRPGTSCDGVDVMRSTDSINFEVIYHIGGICGGPNTAISYDFLDTEPVINYRNYYRLGLGTVGTTSVRSIEVVDLGSQGIQVRPNPVIATSKIYFENPNHEIFRLILVNTSGVSVAQWETREEFLPIQSADFEPAIYFLRIIDADGKLQAQGKLVTVR